MNVLKPHTLALIILIWIIIFVGAVFIFPFGTNPNFDGTTYIAAAKSFASSGALINIEGNPFVHRAPLISIAMSIGYFIGVPISAWLSVLYAAIYASVLIVAFFLSTKLLPSRIWQVVTTAVFALWLPVVRAHINIWSEPLYLFFFLVALIAITELWKRVSWKWLSILIVMSALLALTRYSGIFFILSVIILLLLHPNISSIKKRIIYSIIFGISSSIPIVIWFIRNAVVAGTATNRSLTFSHVDPSVFIEFPSVVMQIFFYGGNNIIVQLITLVLIVGVSFAFSKAYATTDRRIRLLLLAFAIIAATHVLLIGVVNMFIDSSTVFDHRQLLPVLAVLFFGIATMVFYVNRRFSQPWFTYSLSAATTVIAIHFVFGVTAHMKQHSQNLVYTQYVIADVANAITATEAYSLAYTNVIDAVYLASGLHTERLPGEEFSSQWKLETGQSVLVVQGSMKPDWFLETVLQEDQNILKIYESQFVRVYAKE